MQDDLLPVSGSTLEVAHAGEIERSPSDGEIGSRLPMQAEVVYRPDMDHGLGLAGWRAMVTELWQHRELTWRLFLRDFAARYRQSFGGYLWAILPIVATAATFSWLHRAKVLPIAATPLPYPVFVLLSMTVWQLFAGGLTRAAQSLIEAGSLIVKIAFPRETLVLAAFGQTLFEFALRLVLVASAFALYGVMPALGLLFLPLLLLPLCLLTLGLGFLLSLINGVIRDAGQILTLALMFWMFLTPVVYPAPPHSTGSLITLLNPVSPFLIAAQDLASRGTLSQPGSYAIGSLLSGVLFLGGWRIFHITEPRIAERV
jgi:lipopolysaccharide transport system permease protein